MIVIFLEVDGAVGDALGLGGSRGDVDEGVIGGRSGEDDGSEGRGAAEDICP